MYDAGKVKIKRGGRSRRATGNSNSNVGVRSLGSPYFFFQLHFLCIIM